MPYWYLNQSLVSFTQFVSLFLLEQKRFNISNFFAVTRNDNICVSRDYSAQRSRLQKRTAVIVFLPKNPHDFVGILRTDVNRADACQTWFSTVKCLSHLFRPFHSCPCAARITEGGHTGDMEIGQGLKKNTLASNLYLNTIKVHRPLSCKSVTVVIFMQSE